MKERTLAKEILIKKFGESQAGAWEKEFQANAFAEELLMPEEMLLDRFKKTFQKTGCDIPLTARILSKLFRVEYWLMVRRLTRLKAI